MNRERLNQILAERDTDHVKFCQNAHSYFAEALPVIERYIALEEGNEKLKKEQAEVIEHVRKVDSERHTAQRSVTPSPQRSGGQKHPSKKDHKGRKFK